MGRCTTVSLRRQGDGDKLSAEWKWFAVELPTLLRHLHPATDEMLRFDSPVQTDFRIAKAEITVRGRTIQPGDGVILLTGSANRDEAAFEHADTFNIARQGLRHTSFGHGVHQCIGAELAHMEASTVFTEALRTLGTIELAAAVPRYRRSTVVRGLTSVPLNVERR